MKKYSVGDEYQGVLYPGGVVSTEFIPLDRSHPASEAFSEEVTGQCRRCGRLTGTMNGWPNHAGHSASCPHSTGPLTEAEASLVKYIMGGKW
jgi:hypothetical protein